MSNERDALLATVRRSPRARRLLLAALVLVLLAGFLFAAGPRRVLADLADAEPRWLAAGAGATLLALALWSEAQRTLFRAAGAPVPRGRFLLAYLSGNFAKLTLPGGRLGGPAVMAYALGRETDLPYERDLAAATAGKLVGFPAAVVAATAALLTVATPGIAAEARLLLPALTLAVAAVLGVGAVVAVRPHPARRLVHALAGAGRATVGRLSDRLTTALAPDRVDRALAGLGGTFREMGRDRPALALAFALTTAGWGAAALALSAVLVALDHAAVPALALLAVPLSSLGNAVPLPGGAGGVDLALGTVLVAALGLDVAAAGAVVLAYRLVSDGAVVALGGLVTLGRALTR
ncbi:flippase-like domain-containing protein [Haloglomus litoreum]|uniref:flippase-like domain-containing protein n=1 Tax=Haloglomus litoreum TaxID=3034026 RepID=UPI0023E88A4E|nr:flippase-like domain-containing protein [Haloglomus sp. DT116]